MLRLRFAIVETSVYPHRRVAGPFKQVPLLPLPMTFSPNSRSLLTYRLAPIVIVCKDETGASQPFIQLSKIL